MMKRPATIAAGVLGVFALSIPPAMADVRIINGNGQGSCPKGYVCLYENLGLNYSSRPPGKILITNESIPDLGRYKFGDMASSYYNNTKSSVSFYSKTEFLGTEDTVRPGKLGPMPGSQGDNTLSLQILK